MHARGARAAVPTPACVPPAPHHAGYQRLERICRRDTTRPAAPLTWPRTARSKVTATTGGGRHLLAAQRLVQDVIAPAAPTSEALRQTVRSGRSLEESNSQGELASLRLEHRLARRALGSRARLDVERGTKPLLALSHDRGLLARDDCRVLRLQRAQALDKCHEDNSSSAAALTLLRLQRQHFNNAPACASRPRRWRAPLTPRRAS